MRHRSTQPAEAVRPQAERHPPHVPQVDRKARQGQWRAVAAYTPKPHFVSGGAGQPLDARVPCPKRVCHRLPRAWPESPDQRVARPLELVPRSSIRQPGQAGMRCRVRREREPPLLPAPDGVPIEMRQPVPGVAHIPRVQSPDVVRDEERGSRESHVVEYRIDVLAEGRVAVVEGEQELEMRDARCGMRDTLAELCECERPPTRTRQRVHLTCEAGPRNTRDAELEGPTNAMVAQHRRKPSGRDLPHEIRIPQSAIRIV